LASSPSEDPEKPQVAAVCPLTTAACITKTTRHPLSVGNSDACDDAALAHRILPRRMSRIRAFWKSIVDASASRACLTG
jgi:hypothetical protein